MFGALTGARMHVHPTHYDWVVGLYRSRAACPLLQFAPDSAWLTIAGKDDGLAAHDEHKERKAVWIQLG